MFYIAFLLLPSFRSAYFINGAAPCTLVGPFSALSALSAPIGPIGPIGPTGPYRPYRFLSDPIGPYRPLS